MRQYFFAKYFWEMRGGGLRGEVKHVQLRLEDAEFEAFRRKAQIAGFESIQTAGRQALLRADWSGEGPGSGVPAKYRPYMDILAEVLSSGDADLIGLLVKPLEYAEKQLRRRLADGGEHKGG